MKLLQKFRALFRKEKLDAEMSEEMRLHLERRTEENVAAGMSPEDARYAALRKFGGVEQAKEIAREQRGFIWLEQFSQDLRFGARMLRRNPGFTVVVAATLALGIGINTAVFSFYGAVALKPLPVRAPEEIVRVVPAQRENKGEDEFAYAQFDDLAARATSFAALIATSRDQQMLAVRPGADTAAPEPVMARLVSDNYFSSLGVTPILGRSFGPGDSAVGVLSEEVWRRRFEADPAVIGQTLLVQNVAVTIVGVVPASFAGTGRPAAVPDLWMPLALQPALLPTVDWLHDPAVRAWQLLARRKPGASLAQAAAEIDSIGHTWLGADRKPLRLTARKATLFEFDYPEFKAVCAVLMLAVGSILLIGCVNVVNLLSARNAVREHELAVRLALGAGRHRLVRQLCTESILLGLLGGVGGLVLSYWACEIVRTWAVGYFQRSFGGVIRLFFDVTPDWHVFVYTIAVSLLTGIGVGVWPALRATGAGLETGLKQEAAGTGHATRGPWSRRNALLTMQVAACLLLLACAGLLFRGAAHAVTTDPGFDAKHLFVLRINNVTAASTAVGNKALLHETVARVAMLPGVQGATWAERAPYLGHSISPFETDENRWVRGCVMNRVAANYFETLGIAVIAGRSFSIEEQETRASVVMVSQSAATHLWPGKNPLGRRLIDPQPRRDGGRDSYTVVGVTKDVRLTLLSQTDAIDLFFPRPLQVGDNLLVRTRLAPESEFRPTLAALRDIDATLPSQTLMMSMEQGPMQLQRLMAQAPAAFASLLGGLALVLASVGIYGVVSFLVVRRTREIGIRIALGAQRKDIVGLVLRQTLRPVVWGAGIGLMGAVGLSVLITRLVLNPEIPDLTYGAGAFPSATLVGVLGLLLGVIFLAAFVPARSATKVDPIIALRAE
jgi:predicted permease